MFCEYCGKKIDSNYGICTHCGMPVGSDNLEKAEKNNNDSTINHSFSEPTSSMKKMVVANTDPKESFVLAEGEVIVRRYNCANLRNVKGYLTVTNKRLMFNARGGSSRYNQEVAISSVSGIKSSRGTNYDWIKLIIGSLMIILGIVNMCKSSEIYFLQEASVRFAFLMSIIGFVLVALGVRNAFQIVVFARDVCVSPIVIGEGVKSLLGNSAILAFSSTPTEDTDIMLDELGALVQDLQNMGDSAIEKWQSRLSSKDVPSF